MEETCAFLALEADAERLFERCTNGRELWGIAGGFDSGQSVAGIRRQQPRQVFRFGERRAMRQGSAQVVAKTRGNVTGECTGMLKAPLKSPPRLSASRKVSSLAGRPDAYPRRASTKSRVFVTSTSR